ncbi:MAG TPA: hypothetical protein VMF52_05475 [Steroidobacteraceae bacterium]|nr:hypothetical protein [Steroidobacteraceae bacterium]
MAQVSRVRTLGAAAAAYIAGLVDGEGTITMSRLHANERRRLVVSIANTELPLLRFVLDEIGAGKITRKRTLSARHTPSFCYAITSRQAMSLLCQIAPWLRTYKRRRADYAIAHYESLTPRNGKYSAQQLADRRDFETRFLAILPDPGDDGTARPS